MPSPSDLPGDINRKKLTKALERLGFMIDEKGGNGSHFKATWPKTQKCVTIPSKIPKQVLRYIVKEINEYSGLSWDDIKKEL